MLKPPRHSALRVTYAYFCVLNLVVLLLLLNVPPARAQGISVPGARSPVAEEPAASVDNSVEAKVARGEAPLSRLYEHIRPDAGATHRLPSLLDTGAGRGAGPEKKLQVGSVRDFARALDALPDSALYKVHEGEVRVLGIVTEGAKFTRVHFESTSLPAGARLYVYSMNNPDEVYGPYEGRGPSKDGNFWTPPIEGDRVVVEYFAPADSPTVEGSPFKITQVSHTYRDVVAETNGPAGSCNLEVTASYAEPASAVGHLRFVEGGGEFICTGTLLNTRSSNFVPYLITANHCFDTQASAQSLRVFWNYNTGDFPTSSTQRTDGATLLATNPSSDFTFVRLTGSVPVGLWFTGWTTTMPAAGESVTGIHHPNGSHKRISFGSRRSQSGCPSNLPGSCSNFLKVVWDSGVTEGGSSGSELLVGPSSDPRYAGNLLGGASSCSNPTGDDWYGAFSVTYPQISSFLEDDTPAPANDNFAGARVISGSSGSISGSNVSATREAGEPNHVDMTSSSSVWYSWQAPSNGTTTFTTAGSNFDTLLAVYTGSNVGFLSWVGANDDDPNGGRQSRVTFNATAGVTYRIAVDGYRSAQGSIVLNWSLTPASVSNRKTVGVFRPSNGIVYLRNSNSAGFSDIDLVYGNAGDQPVAGDWNGDGVDTQGIYRNGVFFLRNSNSTGPANIAFAFGAAGDLPVAGDWDGDGIDTIGVYRNGVFFLRNSNSAGGANLAFALGNPGDVPIAGDWNGDGVDTVGVFRPSNGIVYLKNSNSAGFSDVDLVYGNAGDQPVAGDWDGNGTDTVGIYRNGVFFLRNSNTTGPANVVFALGNNGDVPIAGDWDGLP